jgi:hypothetical protein
MAIPYILLDPNTLEPYSTYDLDVIYPQIDIEPPPTAPRVGAVVRSVEYALWYHSLTDEIQKELARKPIPIRSKKHFIEVIKRNNIIYPHDDLSVKNAFYLAGNTNLYLAPDVGTLVPGNYINTNIVYTFIFLFASAFYYSRTSNTFTLYDHNYILLYNNLNNSFNVYFLTYSGTLSSAFIFSPTQKIKVRMSNGDIWTSNFVVQYYLTYIYLIFENQIIFIDMNSLNVFVLNRINYNLSSSVNSTNLSELWYQSHYNASASPYPIEIIINNNIYNISTVFNVYDFYNSTTLNRLYSVFCSGLPNTNNLSIPNYYDYFWYDISYMSHVWGSFSYNANYSHIFFDGNLFYLSSSTLIGNPFLAISGIDTSANQGQWIDIASNVINENNTFLAYNNYNPNFYNPSTPPTIFRPGKTTFIFPHHNNKAIFLQYVNDINQILVSNSFVLSFYYHSTPSVYATFHILSSDAVAFTGFNTFLDALERLDNVDILVDNGFTLTNTGFGTFAPLISDWANNSVGEKTVALAAINIPINSPSSFTHSISHNTTFLIANYFKYEGVGFPVMLPASSLYANLVTQLHNNLNEFAPVYNRGLIPLGPVDKIYKAIERENLLSRKINSLREYNGNWVINNNLTCDLQNTIFKEENIRRLANAIARELKVVLKTFMGMVNTQETREKAVIKVRNMLRRVIDIHKYKPDDYLIICDETNNTDYSNYLYMDIYVRMPLSIKYVNIVTISIPI